MLPWLPSLTQGCRQPASLSCTLRRHSLGPLSSAPQQTPGGHPCSCRRAEPPPGPGPESRSETPAGRVSLYRTRRVCDVRSKALGVCHACCLQTSPSLGPGGDSSAGVFTYFSSRHLEVGAPSAAQTGFKLMSSNLLPTPSSLLSGTRVQHSLCLTCSGLL